MKQAQKSNGKGNDFNCPKIQKANTPLVNSKACIDCKAKAQKQYKACLDFAAKAKAAKVAKKSSPRVMGLYGFTKDCFTDLFCRLVTIKPLTMKAIVDFRGNIDNGFKIEKSIGPHPKAFKKLSSQKVMARTSDGLIYVVKYPKGHSKQGQLTPACKLARQHQKEIDKAKADKAKADKAKADKAKADKAKADKAKAA